MTSKQVFEAEAEWRLVDRVLAVTNQGVNPVEVHFYANNQSGILKRGATTRFNPMQQIAVRSVPPGSGQTPPPVRVMVEVKA